jgi:hypothetical protein
LLRPEFYRRQEGIYRLINAGIEGLRRRWKGARAWKVKVNDHQVRLREAKWPERPPQVREDWGINKRGKNGEREVCVFVRREATEVEVDGQRQCTRRDRRCEYEDVRETALEKEINNSLLVL